MVEAWWASRVLGCVSMMINDIVDKSVARISERRHKSNKEGDASGLLIANIEEL